MNTRRLFGLFSLVLTLGAISVQSRAADDLTGQWKWEWRRQGGEPWEITANLKQEGDKLTGTVSSRGEDTKIEEGKVNKDGTFSFVTKLERNNRTFVANYSGKVEGDTIKGKLESQMRNGETRSRDWEPKRVGANVTGNWKTTITRQDGEEMQITYDLKQDGEKVTGTTTWNNGTPREIRDGQIKGNELTFKVVRERDGNTATSTYKAKVEGDKLTGKIESNWGGEAREFDWEATRK